MSPNELAHDVRVPVSRVLRWIRQGKIQSKNIDGAHHISYSANTDFIALQIKKSHTRAWIPEGIKAYSEWHRVLDEFTWLMKLCYSSKQETKKRSFRLDRLFVNYLTVHKISLRKIRHIFPPIGNAQSRLITNDLKRGWYNELFFLFPLKDTTLGLTFADIEKNRSTSDKRFAFPSWRIISAYYPVYFYVRGMTLRKQSMGRIQEHGSAIAGFKNNLLAPLQETLWKFPLDIQYSPDKSPLMSASLVNKLEHMKYVYCRHPRAPWLSAHQTYRHIYASFARKPRVKVRPTTYTSDRLHARLSGMGQLSKYRRLAEALGIRL